MGHRIHIYICDKSICQPGTDGQFCERIFGCRIPLTDTVIPVNRIIRFHCQDDPEFSRLKSQCLADGNWDLPPRCIIRRSRNKLKVWRLDRWTTVEVGQSPYGTESLRTVPLSSVPSTSVDRFVSFYSESQQGDTRCCCVCSDWTAWHFYFLSSLTDNLSCEYTYQILTY